MNSNIFKEYLEFKYPVSEVHWFEYNIAGVEGYKIRVTELYKGAHREQLYYVTTEEIEQWLTQKKIKMI